MTRAERCVRIALELIARGEISTGQAARLGDVRPEVARKDLALLRELLVLRRVGRGRDTRWVIDPLRQERLGLLERISLMIGRDALQFLSGTALFEGLDHAGAGRAEELPPRFAQNIHLKFRHHGEPPRNYDGHREVIDDLLDALLRSREIDLEYRSSSQGHQTLARLQPLTLVLYRRAIYLIARHGSGEISRPLAVDRIARIQVGEPFDYPTDWSPDRHLAPRFGIASGPTEQIVMRFAKRVAHLVRARTWHSTQELIDLPDGRLELRMKAGGLELVRLALEWGPNCEVVAPPALRAKVIEELRGAIDIYRTEPTTRASQEHA